MRAPCQSRGGRESLLGPGSSTGPSVVSLRILGGFGLYRVYEGFFFYGLGVFRVYGLELRIRQTQDPEPASTKLYSRSNPLKALIPTACGDATVAKARNTKFGIRGSQYALVN